MIRSLQDLKHLQEKSQDRYHLWPHCSSRWSKVMGVKVIFNCNLKCMYTFVIFPELQTLLQLDTSGTLYLTVWLSMVHCITGLTCLLWAMIVVLSAIKSPTLLGLWALPFLLYFQEDYYSLKFSLSGLWKCLSVFLHSGGDKGWHVFYHFVGAVPGSPNLEMTLKRLLKEIGAVNVSYL